MNSAQVYSVRAQSAHGFVWKWRANDKGKRVSALGFVSYDDCVADAKKNGYTVSDSRAPE
ncbi:MAG TPA: hypothetical protein VED01_09340 [Burkholderiales bacterium]|nr:hypothetical protein [Burkholderiales bacterium]